MAPPSELTSRAANEERQLISVQTGIGWFGLVRGAESTTTISFLGDTTEFRSQITGTPAVGVAYDYRVNNVLSLGGAASYQSLRFHDFRSDDRAIDPNAELRLNRTLIGARVLFHYGRSERVEMYSGLRMGITVWNLRARNFGEGQVENIDGLGSVTAAVTPQVTFIPFGFRAYLTPQLNLGAEFGLGSPHIAAVQLAYRF